MPKSRQINEASVKLETYIEEVTITDLWSILNKITQWNDDFDKTDPN